MKFLIHSNGPANGTGYGQQTAQLAERLRDAGHDVAISCMTGVSGRPTEWEGILCLPAGMQPFSTDVIGHHAKYHFGGKPGLVLILFDAWCMDPAATAGLATAIWTPVHCSPMTAGDRQYFQAAQVMPIAMSKFGQDQLKAEGIPAPYVPHGIDCETFRPISDDRRAAFRQRFGIPEDAFLYTMVAANKGTSPPRKSFYEAFQAFARVAKKHKDARLFLHTLMSKAGFGLNLVAMIQHLGIEDRVHFSDQYAQVTGLFAPDYVAALMGSSDVFLNPSMGEGFGLPSMEAQACGVPVIAGRNSAQTEYLGAGWLVKGQRYWCHDDEADWQIPLVDDLYSKMQQAYAGARDPKLKAKAREFAEQFDADLVFTQYWKPTIEMLEQFAGAAPVRLGQGGDTQLPVREYDGLKWIFRGGHTDDWIVLDHEENLGPVLDEMLPEGGTFLDVGAHVGRWSLRLAKKAQRVIAVEANPSTAALLSAHVALNGIENVEVITAAAWDYRTMMNLDDPNQKINGGSTRVVEAEGDGDGVVLADTLDRLVLPVMTGRLDLIKLDVEGADLHALRGMTEILKRHQPKILIERHDIYDYYKLDDLKELVESFGYTWREVNILIMGQTALAPYLACEPA